MRLFVLALTLTLIISSVWNRPWQNTVHFVANEHGIYFPAYPAMTLIATPQRVEWLEVPWKHISNIRLVSALGEHGKCVAMDIQVSFLEETRFFEGVGVPNDRLTKTVATVSAAYSNWPPFPAEVFSRLSTLRLTRLGVDPSHALKAIR
ncbi:MAG: hypothetical protein CFE43_14975 [Burkholderiales bacterium PBB3]|nr:MAG: hypothetical protein CFE43_14975 [Burkholderiales bacterium PBB3]